MLDAALDGLGVGYLLDHEVEPYLKEGRLTRVLAEWTPSFPGFHLYYPSRRQMRPVLNAFINAVRHGSVGDRTGMAQAAPSRDRRGSDLDSAASASDPISLVDES